MKKEMKKKLIPKKEEQSDSEKAFGEIQKTLLKYDMIIDANIVFPKKITFMDKLLVKLLIKKGIRIDPVLNKKNKQ